ncbi:CHASE2 domain-containing protein [Methylocucumis oryzae]|uniref:CHASE2 domain-containing protein n=1 Tax=Methylocucumis oryzae TaxID=1632867 RepID=A0A0F3IQ73_9GAMM|nr:CHASE2 domain-containing protein [Methylocucumis oryzae]KJV07724.1 hypothetical protein VZ94_02685 [Methylocucumis oryzae]
MRHFEQNVGLSWLFNIRGAIESPSQVAIVAIDDQTGTALGLSKLPREWPRSIHARVVNELVRRGASVIVFDIDFQIAKQTETDVEFAEAVANSGRVVLVEKLIGKRQPLIDATGKQTGSVWVEQLVPPISALTKAAKGLGPFPLPKVQVAVHQFWVFKSSMNAPTMPAVALQIHLMNAYPRLSELLRKAGKQPPTLSQQASATELVNFMGALRALFLNDPSLGQALRDTIAEDTELAIEQHDSVLALIGLYEGADDRYLNFYGQPGSILTIPYHLIAGANTEQVTLPELKDKVVFVGFSDLYDPGQPDRFYTVYTNDDGVDLSGVEIAATAFANLYRSNAIHPPNLLEELSIVVVFGCVIGFISYFLATITAIPLMLLLVASYLFGAQQVFNTQYLWIPVAIPILIQFPIALLSGLLVNYFSEKKKKERANQAIGFYLPENLARDFTEKNLDHNSLNKVTYSVCFASDMAGFTTIAEVLNPKELAEFLNDYFETLSKPLKTSWRWRD